LAYLITCAGSKRTPVHLNPSTIEDLSFNDLLFDSRERLIALRGIQLDWTKTLPAWQLYSGPRSKTYPPVSITNWNKPCADIRILSALFGWIKYTDRIPYYDLMMEDTIASTKQKVNKYWFNQNLLDQVISEADIDLLSKVYRKAINWRGVISAIEPAEHFTDRGVQKGIWLNNQLSLINCD